MFDALQFFEFGALVRRQAAGSFSIEQGLQAGHGLGRRGEGRDLCSGWGTGQEGENAAVQAGRQGRLVQTQGQEFGQAILQGTELVGQLVWEIQGNPTHDDTSCEQYIGSSVVSAAGLAQNRAPRNGSEAPGDGDKQVAVPGRFAVQSLKWAR